MGLKVEGKLEISKLEINMVTHCPQLVNTGLGIPGLYVAPLTITTAV